MNNTTAAAKFRLGGIREILGDMGTPAITTIPLDILQPFPNHKFQMYTGKKLQDLADNIKERGVLTPILVWLKHEDGNNNHIILSGHNRVNGARLAGLDKIPAVTMENLTPKEAELIVIESNLFQRSFTDLSHAERVAVLYQHYVATKEQGQHQALIADIEALARFDLSGTIVPVLKRRSIDKTCTYYGLSRGTVARYLRLHHLHPGLLERLDAPKNKLAVRAAVEIAALTMEEQQMVLDCMISGMHIDMVKAKLLRKNKGTLDRETIETIIGSQRVSQDNKLETVLKQFFPTKESEKNMTEKIAEALTLYFNGEE